jgi:lysozyme
MDIGKMVDELIRDEGVRIGPYLDSVGKLTIGIGRNLDDVGITVKEARYLCLNDIFRAMGDLDTNIGWWRELTEGRQRVMVNMCFNLGITRLLGFRNTLQAIQEGRYVDAATSMLDSKWAKQVGPRAVRLAETMRTGGTE